MAQPEQRPCVNAGPTRRPALRVAALLVAAMFLALAFGLTARPSGAAHDPVAGAVSAPGVTGHTSLIGRNSAVNPLLALAQPVGHRRLAFGDVTACALALVAAYLFGKRSSLGAGRRLRFDAVFEFRRGPPTASVAY